MCTAHHPTAHLIRSSSLPWRFLWTGEDRELATTVSSDCLLVYVSHGVRMAPAFVTLASPSEAGIVVSNPFGSSGVRTSRNRTSVHCSGRGEYKVVATSPPSLRR